MAAPAGRSSSLSALVVHPARAALPAARRCVCRRALIPLAAALLCQGAALAADPAPLQPSTSLAPVTGNQADSRRPMILLADDVKVRPDLDAVAEHGDLRTERSADRNRGIAPLDLDHLEPWDNRKRRQLHLGQTAPLPDIAQRFAESVKESLDIHVSNTKHSHFNV